MLVWSMSVTTGSIVDRAVDQAELPRGGLGLGKVVGDVLLVEEDLALEVVRLDEVAVDDPDPTDPRADQVIRQHGAERPAAADRDAAGQELALARLAQRGEADLAAVTVERVGHINGHERFLGQGSGGGPFPDRELRFRGGPSRAADSLGTAFQPPATAGMMLTSSCSATAVSRSSR